MPPINLSSTTASTAVSSTPDPAPCGLCAIHQPNFFPRLSTLAKLFAADYWIVLDDVQFTRRDYQHRARLAALDDPDDCRWLSIPTHLSCGRQTLIREAVMAEPPRSRQRTARVLRQHYGTSTHWPAFEQALAPVLDAFSGDRTAAVAEASARALLDLLGWRGRIVRSSGLPARPGRSQRLADLAAAVGARSYLCGPGGMHYLRPAPFAAYNIAVIPFATPHTGLWEGSHTTSAVRPLMQAGPSGLATELRMVAARAHATPPVAAATPV
ncbi:WbqC family protein [Streptomyces sp. NPDC000405]|uniref:WbqC family protein n=1 Tax=Streptomyces sp. NPDC000405 TaxID=3161033 RepID=UPI00398D3E6E